MELPEAVPHPDTEETAAVTAADVTREYFRGKSGLFGSDEVPTVKALDGVSLSIATGEVVGIAGPSGSGKSTLLHLLAGLDLPTSGTVEVVGTDISGLSNRQRARLRLDNVGIVFQRFHLLDALSARANTALPLVERGVSKRDRRTKAESLLEAVGLEGRISHKPGQLSGGEQQRVAIARSLVTDPTLIVADEPTGELDSESGRRVLELLDNIADERAVVLASHDRQALEFCDRVLHLRDGHIERDQ